MGERRRPRARRAQLTVGARPGALFLFRRSLLPDAPLRPVLFLPLLFALALPAAAQTPQPAPAPQTAPARRDTLPPLAPQDVEIRGQLRVRLPSIARQPLGGIAPVQPPRRLDPQRTPEAPTYGTPALPESPLARFDPPALPDLTPGPPQRAGLEGGAGLFLSRFSRLTANVPVGRSARFVLGGHYDGTDGQRLGGLRRGFNDGSAHAGVQYATATTTVDVLGGGIYRTWDAPIPVDSLATRALSGASATLAAAFETPRVAVRFDARPAYAALRLPGRTPDETQLALGMGVEVPLARLTPWVDVRHARHRFDGAEAVAATGLAVGAAGQAGGVRYRVGPRLLAYTDGAGETASSVTADVDVRAVLGNGLAVSLTNAPSAHAPSWTEVLAEVPYASVTALLPEAVPVNLRLRGDLTRGPFTLAAWLGVRQATQQRYAVSTASDLAVFHAAVAGPQAGLAARYATARGLSAHAEVTVRSFGFADSSGARATVPYLAPLVGAIRLAHPLPRGGVVQASLVGQGARYGGRSETLRLGSTVDLDLYASMALRGALYGIVRADRILAVGRTRYVGYPETTGLWMLGMGIRW